VRVFRSLKDATRWSTARGIAQATGVSRRCTTDTVKRFTELGITEQWPMFPAPLYRVHPEARDRVPGLLRHLDEAVAVLGG
jgi:hypothetical protein